MAGLNPLPERLQYLESFRKQFARRPNEVNEETAYNPLIELLKNRIAGLSEEAAAKLLAEDIVELGKWLAAPEQVSDCLHFAEGVFLIASPSDLVKQIVEEAAKEKKTLPWVEMDLPPKAKQKRFERDGDGGMLVQWNELMFSVSVANEEWVAKKEKPHEFWDPAEALSCKPVLFGGVTGFKYTGVRQTEFALPEKLLVPERRIVYILAVPGGHVKISLSCVGKKPNLKWDEAKLVQWRREQVRLKSSWDEKPVEALFQTLRIDLKQSAETKKGPTRGCREPGDDASVDN